MNTQPLRGIYPPVPTFFDAQEDLDVETLRQHLRRLAESPVAGYVLMGSNGEAVHLTDDERRRVIETARQVMKELSSSEPEEARMLLIAGCGDLSTRTTITHCEQAARCGADIALVLPPAYYKSHMNTNALLTHYRTVASASPLPVLLYNMPANTGGLDLSASLISTLAEHPNIVGVKDSAGNIAKLAQLVSTVSKSFAIFAGSASYLLPALSVGASGAVAALANVLPREVCEVQALFESGRLEEARALQAQLIPLNDAVTSGYGVAGLKAALQLLVGYGGAPRLPLLPLGDTEYTSLAELLRHARIRSTPQAL